MKKLIALTLIATVIGLALPQEGVAGDLGAQKLASTISTNNFDVDLPIGETGRFDPEFLIFTGLPVSTQVIEYVASGYTGSIAAASTASLVAISNIPTLFFGDKIVVTPNGLSGTNTFTATLIGTVFD